MPPSLRSLGVMQTAAECGGAGTRRHKAVMSGYVAAGTGGGVRSALLTQGPPLPNAAASTAPLGTPRISPDAQRRRLCRAVCGVRTLRLHTLRPIRMEPQHRSPFTPSAHGALLEGRRHTRPRMAQHVLTRPASAPPAKQGNVTSSCSATRRLCDQEAGAEHVPKLQPGGQPDATHHEKQHWDHLLALGDRFCTHAHRYRTKHASLVSCCRSPQMPSLCLAAPACRADLRTALQPDYTLPTSSHSMRMIIP